jgi:hypothetical protein
MLHVSSLSCTGIQFHELILRHLVTKHYTLESYLAFCDAPNVSLWWPWIVVLCLIKLGIFCYANIKIVH